MIYSRQLTSQSPEWEVLRRIYEDSFPADERRDYDSLLQLVETEDSFNMEAVYLDDMVVGFISSWRFDEWRYIEHFAVDAAMRGSGIGQVVLRNFVESDTLPVVLEVEPPIDEMCRRRVDFYTRQGFVLHDSYRYIQPPYDSGRNEVELRLMTCGASSACNLDALAALLHRRVYGVKR